MFKLLLITVCSLLIAYANPNTDRSLVTNAESLSTYESARDFLNGIQNIQPRFIEIGQYQPGQMSEEMYGIWLEYEARNRDNFELLPHYFRLRDIVGVELSQNAFGVCQMKLTGAEFETGYYWENSQGWQRGLGTLNFRSDDCGVLRSAGEAFVQLSKLDGGEASFDSKLD